MLLYTRRAVSAPGYDSERRFALEAVREACTMAWRVQDRIAATREALTKDDRSPVTIADLAIQAVVSLRLGAAFPDDALLAEEESELLRTTPAIADAVLDLARHAAPELTLHDLLELLDRGGGESGPGRRWVLDPIDGTKGFLRGDQYAVALALVADGRVVVGTLGCPNLAAAGGGSERSRGCLFSAERGRGAISYTMDGARTASISVDGIRDPAAAVICESVEAAHAAHSEQAAIARRLGIASPPYRIDSQCKYAVVARGEASIYLRLPRRADYREKAWDHAAGTVIIEEAGGRVSDLEGHPLDFTGGSTLARHHGIVATNGHLHAEVLAACRQVLGLA